MWFLSFPVLPGSAEEHAKFFETQCSQYTKWSLAGSASKLSFHNVACVVTAGRMLCGRRAVLVFVVGLLFGYTLMYAVLHSLYTQWNVRQSSAAYVVPSAPHSHAEMNLDVPALHDVHQWHDFDESSHFSSLTFTFIYRVLTTLETWKTQGICYFWKTHRKLREFEIYSGNSRISYAIFMMQSVAHNKPTCKFVQLHWYLCELLIVVYWILVDKKGTEMTAKVICYFIIVWKILFRGSEKPGKLG